MGRLLQALAGWLLRSLRVEVSAVHEAVDKCDRDRDGFISLGELVGIVRSWVGGLGK